jgi:hypothetical protein
MTTAHEFKTSNPDKVYGAIKRLALSEAATAGKISMRKIFEIVRAQLATKINNNDLTAFTDKLRAECPQLKDRIQVRERGRRGANKTKPANDNADYVPGLASGRALQFAHSQGNGNLVSALFTPNPQTDNLALRATQDRLYAEIRDLKAKLEEARSDRDFLIDLAARTSSEGV